MRALMRVLFGLVVSMGSFVAALAIPAIGVQAAGCLTASPTTMTAVIVATSGQHISGSIDATGCDLGVYVGPGVTGVTISGATISGAGRHAILVQNTSGVGIDHNTVTGTNPNHQTGERKAIELQGTSHVIVVHNTVTNNNGGGIAVQDDGPQAPGGLSSANVPSVGNLVAWNDITDNGGACGIVVAAYQPGAGVANNKIIGNTVERNPAGIIIATDAPSTTATTNLVLGNTTGDDDEAGIVVHANAPGDQTSHTFVIGNTIGVNASGVGILIQITPGGLGMPPAVLDHTIVVNNTISNQPTPILRQHDTNTVVAANRIV